MRAVLWDLDGTLVDSRQDLAASGNAVRQAMGLEPLALSVVTAMIGDGLTVLLQRMLPEGSDIDWAKDIFSAHYDQQCTQQTHLYDGIAEAVQNLYGAGWRLALVSNKPLRWCQQILSARGIAPYFSALIGGDGARKPQADPLYMVCKELAVPIAQAVMVGDLANDILAAQAAGCASVHVGWGFADLPAGLSATARCSAPSQLPSLLDDLLPGS